MKKFLRLLAVLLVIALVGELLRELGVIAVRLHVNGETASLMTQLLRHKYADIDCTAAASYREPTIYVVVYGVTDHARQTEIEGWLRNFKEAHCPDVEIWLEWWENWSAINEQSTIKF